MFNKLKPFLLLFILGILVACTDETPVVIAPVDFDLGAHWGNLYFDDTHDHGARVFTTVDHELMIDEELLNLYRAVFFRYSGSKLITETGDELEIQQRPNLLTIDFGDEKGYIFTAEVHQLNIYAGMSSCDWQWCLRYYPEDLETENPWFRRHRSDVSYDQSRIVGVLSPLILHVGEFINYRDVNYFLELHWDNLYERQSLQRRRSHSRGVREIEYYEQWTEAFGLDFRIIYDELEDHEGEYFEILDVILLFDERQDPIALEVFIGPRYVRNIYY